MSTTPQITQTNPASTPAEPHVHGENCNHSHDHDPSHPHKHQDNDSDSDDNNTDPNKKSSRSQKKFKKAMVKLGLKPVVGINRVTVRKGKQFTVSIDNPDILQTESTYVIFGKVNMDDKGVFGGNNVFENFAQQPAAGVEKANVAGGVVGGETGEQQGGESEVVQDLNEEGLSAENIKMVMEYTKCTRAAAVKALKESGDDSVNAIMKITG